MLQMIKLYGEVARDTGLTTGCFKRDLDALDCRKGCSLCPLDELIANLETGFKTFEEGPGMYLSNMLYPDLYYGSNH